MNQTQEIINYAKSKNLPEKELDGIIYQLGVFNVINPKLAMGRTKEYIDYIVEENHTKIGE